MWSNWEIGKRTRRAQRAGAQPRHPDRPAFHLKSDSSAIQDVAGNVAIIGTPVQRAADLLLIS
jgi:hypothetical protein